MIQALVSILTLFLFFTFLFSSISKIINLRNFVEIVIEYKVLPNFPAKIFGYTLPFFEGGAALLLLFNGTIIMGLTLHLILLCSFGLAVSIVLKNNRKIVCGCHGEFFDATISSYNIVKIGFLIVVSLVVLFFIQKTILSISIYESLIGILLSMFLLAVDKLWSKYSNSIELIREMRGQA